jgi:hypothetical protein
MARKASNKLAASGGKHGPHDGVEAHPQQCRRANAGSPVQSPDRAGSARGLGDAPGGNGPPVEQ